MTFYRDENRPFGANNLVYPDVAMPHALVDLQGVQARKEDAGEDGHAAPKGAGDLLELVEPGSMSVAEYRRVVRDLGQFHGLYRGAGQARSRYVIGGWVLLFLLVFFVIARLLYKEYWKDVH